MEDQKEQSNQILNPHQISKLLTTSRFPIPECLLTKHVHLLSLQQAKFKPGCFSKNIRWNLEFGCLYKGPNYKMIGSNSTKMKCVSKIIHLQNSSGIIANYKDEFIQKVKFKSDEIKVENEIKTKVFDLAMMPDGKLLLSKETSDLELFSMNGDREFFHSFYPFLTFGVYVCKDEIFVGIAKSLEKSKNYRDGRIVVLDMKGQEKCTFGTEIKSGKLFFNCPTRIVANSDIICVIDTFKRDEDNNMLSDGRIVGLNHKGEKKWSYSDKSGALFELFHPQNITLTSAGLILASDYRDDSIHAINKDGDITGWIKLQDIGNPRFPMSVDVDDQGILWVGCGTKKNYQEVKTQKIYSFKLS
ncbi:unnamed protein product [Mytilus coruscus]|uniref:Uncharacterized protein n=1 Tax=Mytilus coruscus TaxID=42192 RepID=A0A6J7ZZ88_MYTCO|nr:unnamed protein product [Mytilus coruscus]